MSEEKSPIESLPYYSKARWPAPVDHLEEFITSSGHDLTIDHSKGERIEERYAEFKKEFDGALESKETVP